MGHRQILKKLFGRSESKSPSASANLKSGANVDLEYARIFAEGNNVIGNYSKVSGELHLGYATTLGISNYVFGGEVSFGRYCQSGAAVGIYAMNHPTEHLTTYLNNRLFSGRLKQYQQKEFVRIGNDVWIGHGAIILPQVTVGDGAIIGAGAVVTKDVEDYGIAVGNPAKVLRKRFEPEIIDLLKELQWWNLSPTGLEKIEHLFHLDFVAEPQKARSELESILKNR